MKFEDAINEIQSQGFSWARLEKYFPFDQSLREGNYQRLLSAALESLGTKDERTAIMDLMDARGCVLLEQIWLQDEMRTDQSKIGGTLVAAQLQINDNLRHQFGLPGKGARTAMFNLAKSDRLIDRIVQPTISSPQPSP